jgi:hypothetical protein
MNSVKEDGMNGTAYEDRTIIECRILTDEDRFCGANRCKHFCAKAVGHHVVCDWTCNIYTKSAYWCSTEIAYRYGTAIRLLRSDVGCAHQLPPDACKFLQQMSTTLTTKDRRETAYHSFFITKKKKSWVNISA